MITVALAALLIAPSQFFYAGGDPSEIPEVESIGSKYKVKGAETDPILAMKNAGWTAVRLRVWNDPKDKFCDLSNTLAMAKRIKAAGMKLMIDFHYSDYWADPGKQNKPAAWKDMKLPELRVAVENYSKSVIKALVDQGTPADVVQPGNEVTNGFLWPEARLNINTDGWQNFIDLSRSAIKGIRDGAGKFQPKIMVHIDQGGRNLVSRFWFDMYFKMGGEADLIGLSYYPMWHGTLDDLSANLKHLAQTYHKDIIIAETAFPYMGWNNKTRTRDDNLSPVKGLKANPEGQREFMKRLIKVVKSTLDGHGAGILWWAPAWLSQPGRSGGWASLTMFDNATGEALPSFFELGKVR